MCANRPKYPSVFLTAQEDNAAFLADLIGMEKQLNLQLTALEKLKRKSHLLSFPSAVGDTIHYLNDALLSLNNAKIAFGEFNKKTPGPNECRMVHLAKMRGCIDFIMDRQNKIPECIENIVETDTKVTAALNEFKAAYSAVCKLFTTLLDREVYQHSRSIPPDFLKDKFQECIAAARSKSEEKKSDHPTNTPHSLFQMPPEGDNQTIIQDFLEDNTDNLPIDNPLQLAKK